MYGAVKQTKSPKQRTKKSMLFGKVKEKEKTISNQDIHTNLYSLKSTKTRYGMKYVPVKIIGKFILMNSSSQSTNIFFGICQQF